VVLIPDSTAEHSPSTAVKPLEYTCGMAVILMWNEHIFNLNRYRQHINYIIVRIVGQVQVSVLVCSDQMQLINHLPLFDSETLNDIPRCTNR
jgi:hypothetical protein